MTAIPLPLGMGSMMTDKVRAMAAPGDAIVEELVAIHTPNGGAKKH